MGIQPDSDDCMVVVPEFVGLDTSEDLTRLEAALLNSSLDDCKEVFPCRESSANDDEDGGQDRGEGDQMGDHAHITTIDFGGASGNPFSNSGKYFGYNGD